MGCSGSKSTQIGNRPITITLLGLDNAGKTTLAKVLEKTSIDFVTRTVGFAQYEIIHNNAKIKLYDLGGKKDFRPAWRHYYDDSYGFIYVIDSSKKTHLDENYEELKRLLHEEKVKNKPILILANKQDKSDALDRNAILENLKIERLVNDTQTLCRVELCTTKLSSSDEKTSLMDPSIQIGFDWLVKTIYENYDILHKRIQQDIQKRNEAEQKERDERRKAVLKIREEREKQSGEENDQNPSTITDGFVPIQQAIKNAEKQSTVANN